MSLSNIIKEYKSLRDPSVKIYVKGLLTNVSAYTLVLKRKFEKQGIKNKISDLIDDTAGDLSDISLYIKLLQSENEQWYAKHDFYALEELKMRQRIQELEMELDQYKGKKI